MNDTLQQPISKSSEPDLPSDSSLAEDRETTSARMNSDSSGEESANAALSSQEEVSASNRQQGPVSSDSSPKTSTEVVCDFDDPTRLKLMKWRDGKADIAPYFDDDGRRCQPGNAFTA